MTKTEIIAKMDENLKKIGHNQTFLPTRTIERDRNLISHITELITENQTLAKSLRQFTKNFSK